MESYSDQDNATLSAAVGLLVSALTEFDDDDDLLSPQLRPTLTNTPRALPKSRRYFQQIERMDDQEFFTHFRLGRGNIAKYWFSEIRIKIAVNLTPQYTRSHNLLTLALR